MLVPMLGLQVISKVSSFRNLSLSKNKNQDSRIDPNYDGAFKTIFGSKLNKSITQQFISNILGSSVSDMVLINTGVQTDNVILKRTTSAGEKILVEIQRGYQRNFEKLILFYGSKIYWCK